MGSKQTKNLIWKVARYFGAAAILSASNLYHGLSLFIQAQEELQVSQLSFLTIATGLVLLLALIVIFISIKKGFASLKELQEHLEGKEDEK